MPTTLRIATRQSPLALWQANYVKQQLQLHHPALQVELIPMVTKGDILLDTPLAKIGGKGLFVKQLEQALLENQADIAVHSIKDVPVQFPAGLQLSTICQRAEVRDAFVSNHYATLAQLPQGAVVGTSSLRRQAQLRALYPQLQIRDLRGNVGTRLQKLDQGDYDAIILAGAGLQRLQLTARITQLLPIEQMLPAVGQGAVGIESRCDDTATLALLACLDHQPTRVCITAERAMNQTLQGGCQVPIGCLAQLQADQLQIQALVGSLDGKTILRSQISGPASAAEQLGTELAHQLLAQGADKILAEIYAL